MRTNCRKTYFAILSLLKLGSSCICLELLQLLFELLIPGTQKRVNIYTIQYVESIFTFVTNFNIEQVAPGSKSIGNFPNYSVTLGKQKLELYYLCLRIISTHSAICFLFSMVSLVRSFFCMSASWSSNQST